MLFSSRTLETTNIHSLVMQRKEGHFCNLFFSLVFRVGCRRKQQAAQWDGDLIPTGENSENGRKRWRKTPSFWYPDIWWENRMGTSQRCADKRSRQFLAFFRHINQAISHLLPFSIQIKPTVTLWPWSRAACVWYVWMNPAAWSLVMPLGPCWCCTVAAARRMARTAGMTSHCR